MTSLMMRSFSLGEAQAQKNGGGKKWVGAGGGGGGAAAAGRPRTCAPSGCEAAGLPVLSVPAARQGFFTVAWPGAVAVGDVEMDVNSPLDGGEIGPPENHENRGPVLNSPCTRGSVFLSRWRTRPSASGRVFAG